jgi:ribosome biogenesis GTPase
MARDASAVVSNVDTRAARGLDDGQSAAPQALSRPGHNDAIVPVVVLTKADVAGAAGALDSACGSTGAFRGHRTFAVNALDPSAAVARGLSRARPDAGGTGLIRRRQIDADQRAAGAAVGIQARYGSDSRGKHTTTARSLHRLPGRVRDRHAQRAASDGDEATVTAAYDDIAGSNQVPVSRLRHAEAQCAVRGGISADRLRNYHSSCAGAPRRDDGARPAARPPMKRGRAATIRIKAKRGE